MFSVDKSNVFKEMRKLKKTFKLFLKKNAGLLEVIPLHFLCCVFLYIITNLKHFYGGNCL